MVQELLIALAGLIIGGLVAWVFVKRSQPNNNTDQLHGLHNAVNERLDSMMQQVDRRLRENVHAMNESKSFLANRVSATERTVREVSSSLGKLENATQALHKTNQEITSFQQMLKSPKVRGSFGEVLLGNLLGEVLVSDQYQMQHTFPNGSIADAVIFLQDGHKVAVDAKFPLANYEAYYNAEEEHTKKAMRKEFTRDVKKHVKDISTKYILPQEKTLDIAFMYIPLEGVYYETMMRDDEESDLWQYCISHHVIPVSPNSLYGYLQTVLVGLRGMKIEEQARDILRHIGQLRSDFKKFSDDFSKVGTHLNHAKNSYENSFRRLDTFTNRLDQIETGDGAEQEQVEKLEKTAIEQ